MAKLTHRIEYLFAKLFVNIANNLTENSANTFGRILGKLFYYTLKSRRKIANDNLFHAFGDTITEAKRAEVNCAVFQNIGLTFIELARFKNLGHTRLNEKVIPGGLEYFKQAKEGGKGGILVTSHFGNWELGAAWVVAQGYTLDVVAKMQSNPLVDRLITELRTNMDVRVILVKNSTLRDIVKSLKDNNFVAMVADQHDPSGTLQLEFFGRKASVARGPAAFARRQNCPLLPFMSVRLSDNSHEILAHSPIYPSLEMDEESDIIRMTREYLDYFEKIITQYPEQWMWTHRRWKI